MGKVVFNKEGGPATLAPATETPKTPVAGTAAAGPATGDAAAAPAACPVAQSETAVATRPALPPPAPVSASPYLDEDAINPDDLVLPRLNIVQKVGELSNVFVQGSFLLNGELVLAEGAPLKKQSKPIKLMVVGFKKTTFVEKVEGGGRGQEFTTKEEVVAAGGTLDYNESKATGKPQYVNKTTALVVVEQPEGVGADLFPHVIDGKNYALALWTLKASGYTNGAKPIMSARKIGFIREGGYRFGFWNVSTELTNKGTGSNYYYIPVPKPAGPTTEAFRAGVKELLGY